MSGSCSPGSASSSREKAAEPSIRDRRGHERPTGRSSLVVVLFLISIVLALAETAFARMNRSARWRSRKRAQGRAASSRRCSRTRSGRSTRCCCSCSSASSPAPPARRRCSSARFGTLGFVIGLVLQIVVFFVIGEVVPKTYAIQHTDRAALRCRGFLWAITNFPPLRLLSRGLIGLANVMLPGKGLKEGPFVTEEDLRHDGRRRGRRREIEREERRLIHSIFEFGDTVVREVMLPRPDMVAIEADETVEEGIARRDRRRLLADPRLRGHHRQHHRPRVPEGPRASGRAGRGRRAGARCRARGGVRARAEARRRAAARDADEAVPHGDRRRRARRDRRARDARGRRWRRSSARSSTSTTSRSRRSSSSRTARSACRGRTPIDEVNEALGVELPDAEWDTVGGLVFNLLGQVPDEGETVRFQGLEFRTERVEGRRIVSVVDPTRRA